jgi:hypothetical protein
MEEDAHWVRAYRRAADKRLPKPLRVFGWQVLHAALPVGDSRVYAARSREELLRCCCRHPQCQPRQQQPAQPPQQQQQQQQQQGGQEAAGGEPPPLPPRHQLESLTHMFVLCPSVRGAWQWLEGVWGRVQLGGGPNCSDVRVLLLDDSSVWQPPAELQQLWTHLRLLMLESVWAVRCAAGSQQYTSTQVVCRFIAALQQQLQQDWARTRGDIRLNSGVPLSWLRGRSPVLSESRFAAKWQGSGVLYDVTAEGSVRVCLSS